MPASLRPRLALNQYQSSGGKDAGSGGMEQHMRKSDSAWHLPGLHFVNNETKPGSEIFAWIVSTLLLHSHGTGLTPVLLQVTLYSSTWSPLIEVAEIFTGARSAQLFPDILPPLETPTNHLKARNHFTVHLSVDCHQREGDSAAKSHKFIGQH